MEKSIKHLIDYLEDVHSLIERNKTKIKVNKVKQLDNKIIIQLDSVSPDTLYDANEIQTEIKNIIRIIKTPEEELAMRKEIFDDYAILSDYIEMAKLNVSDIY